MNDSATATRMARCSYFRSCGHELTSVRAREVGAFFQDKNKIQDSCVECRYTLSAHRMWDGLEREGDTGFGKWPARLTPHAFVTPTDVPEFDEFYCGCRGWD